MTTLQSLSCACLERLSIQPWHIIQLLRQLQQAGALPCCRWAFLSHEEQALAGSQVSTTLELPTSARLGQRTVSLFQLYKLATRVAPKSNDRAYLQLWLGYARHQGWESPALTRLPCTGLLDAVELPQVLSSMLRCSLS